MLNAHALQSIEKRVKENNDQHPNERTIATLDEFFKGLWDYMLSLASLTWFCTFDKKLWFHPVRKPSAMREATYEIIIIVLVGIPFIIALSLRATLVPSNVVGNGCTGCIVGWEDVVIVAGLTITLSIPAAVLMYTVAAFNIPDPLLLITDMKRG